MYPNPYESPDINLHPKTFGSRVFAYPLALNNPVPNIALTPMVLDVERWDNLDEFSLVGVNYVFGPKKAGIYLFVISVAWDIPMGAGFTFIRFYRTPAVWMDYRAQLTANNQFFHNITVIDWLVPTDTCYIRLYQSTGAPRNYSGAVPNRSSLIIQRIG